MKKQLKRRSVERQPPSLAWRVTKTVIGVALLGAVVWLKLAGQLASDWVFALGLVFGMALISTSLITDLLGAIPDWLSEALAKRIGGR